MLLLLLLLVVSAAVDINGEAVVRAYTPVSGDRDVGVLDFLIKVCWQAVEVDQSAMLVSVVRDTSRVHLQMSSCAFCC